MAFKMFSKNFGISVKSYSVENVERNFGTAVHHKVIN